MSWIAASHEWLGMGDYPDRPIVDYLARSLSLFYGLVGLLLTASGAVYYYFKVVVPRRRAASV